jgi:hypothetical protein
MGAREEAIKNGNNTYIGKRPCKHHGHREKYVHNRWCIDCHREKANSLRRDDKSISKTQWHKHERRFRLYGVSEQFCRDLYAKQQGICPICDQSVSWEEAVIDHCHDTGKVRGMLHSTCNTGLGHLHDDIKLLQNAIEYLRNNAETSETRE